MLAKRPAWQRLALWVFGLLLALLSLCSCQHKQTPDMTNSSKGKTMATITVTSTAFKQGELIPGRFTCDGENVSPPLAWSGVPDGAVALAVMVDDPDAPRGIWTHWILYNLPPNTTELTEGIPKKEELPNGARQGTNDSKHTGYDGPCPPSGTHRYFFHVYALDQKLAPVKGMMRQQFLEAIKGHVLVEGELMGRYARKKK